MIVLPHAMLNSQIDLTISCRPSDWQLSSLAQVWSSALSPLLTLERLEIREHRECWQDDIEVTQWLELLRPFISVKNLVLSKKLVQLLAPTLQVLAEESTVEALPALERLSLRGPQPSGPVKDRLGSSSPHDSSLVVPSLSTTSMTKGLKCMRTMIDGCFRLSIRFV